MSDYFKDIPTIKYEGRDSTNPLSFKFYDANKKNSRKNIRGTSENGSMLLAYF